MVDSDTLTIIDFIFEMDSCQNATFIKNIKYKNQNLECVKKDTMVTYQIGFEI